MLYSSTARGKVVMCDPVCEHRSCHTIYFILPIDDIGYWTIPSFVAWRALYWYRRTSVRPPHDIEKSVAHILHCHDCAMPLSGNFAIQAPIILVKLAFSLRRHFFNGGSAISYSENMEKQRAAQVIRRTLAIIQ